MRTVHLVKGRVVYVYWIDRVYEQNYQLNEVKGQFSQSKEKYAKNVVIFRD